MTTYVKAAIVVIISVVVLATTNLWPSSRMFLDGANREAVGICLIVIAVLFIEIMLGRRK